MPPMGATKRRTIWMPDDEWAALVDFAKRNGRTVSTVIRDSWGPPDGYSPVDENDFPDPPEGDRFNTRPFTPVPKKR
jgi:hypothetical protein